MIPVKDPAARARALLSAMSKLAALLLSETTELKAMRVAKTAPLQAAKEPLLEQYRAEIQALKADRAWLKALPSTLAEELRQAATAFAAIATENRRAIKGAQDANEHLFRVIAAEMRERDEVPPPYVRNGRPPVARRAATTRPVSLDSRT